MQQIDEDYTDAEQRDLIENSEWVVNVSAPCNPARESDFYEIDKELDTEGAPSFVIKNVDSKQLAS